MSLLLDRAQLCMTARDPRIIDHKVIFYPAPNINDLFDQRVDFHTLDDKERILRNATGFFIHTAIIMQMPPRINRVQSYCTVTWTRVAPCISPLAWEHLCVTIFEGEFLPGE